jgi:hypothetical protein
MINNFNAANSADQQIEIINNYQSIQKIIIVTVVLLI